ncbi:NAD(P)H-quinone oxidoreductase subunit J, chloroplastic [Streptomyces californicus]
MPRREPASAVRGARRSGRLLFGRGVDRLPDAVADVFGDEAAAESAYDLLTVDVPAATWLTALRTARDELGCTYFDWLSAVDEPGVGFRVCAHVAALGTGTVWRLMVRTTVPHGAAVLPSAVDVYAGAAWHERETPRCSASRSTATPTSYRSSCRKASKAIRCARTSSWPRASRKAWPGAKEPGRRGGGRAGPKRRAMLSAAGVARPERVGPPEGPTPPGRRPPGPAARPRPTARPAAPARAGEGAGGPRPTTPGPRRGSRHGPLRAQSPGAPATPQAPATPEAPAAPEASRGTGGAPRRRRSLGCRRPPRGGRAARAGRGRLTGSASQQRSADGSRGDAVRCRPAAPAAASAEPGQSTPGAGRAGNRSAGPHAVRGRPRKRMPAPALGGGPTRPRARRHGRRVRSADAPWHDAQPAFDEPANPEPTADPEPADPGA